MQLVERVIVLDYRETFRRAYDAVDPWHFGDSPFEKTRHDAMSRFALTLSPRRALDLGCGEGHFLENLFGHDPGIEATGVELDGRAAARARDRLNRYKADIVHADLLDYLAGQGPGVRQSFDVAFCGDVLYFLTPDVVSRQVVPVVADLLKPGGGVVLSYADVNNHEWSTDVFLSRFRLVHSVYIRPEQEPPPWPWRVTLMALEG